MKKIIKLILKYFYKEMIPAFGLLCLLCAGNIPTFILGLGVTIISLYDYLVDMIKEEKKQKGVINGKSNEC